MSNATQIESLAVPLKDGSVVTVKVIWTDGVFATHLATQDDPSAIAYSATHIKSRFAVTPLMPSEAHARAFALWLVTLACDWDREHVDMSSLPSYLLRVREWIRVRPRAPSPATIKAYVKRTYELRAQKIR